jgi:hypothetical protein
MTIRTQILAGLTLLLSSYGLALSAGKDSDQSTPLEAASVRFEQNATDGDVEVVFEVNGGDQGLAKLTVFSPDGRTVIDFAAPGTSALGIRKFQLESPEPKDIEKLKAAYPEGTYRFAGTNVAGDKLHGESTLSHELPATVSFLRPGAGATGVGTKDLAIAWSSVANAANYIIEIEQDELDVKIGAQLPKTAATFAVPNGLLLPGTEYKLAIGTVTEEGNISVVETTFTTAE